MWQELAKISPADWVFIAIGWAFVILLGMVLFAPFKRWLDKR